MQIFASSNYEWSWWGKLQLVKIICITACQKLYAPTGRIKKCKNFHADIVSRRAVQKLQFANLSCMTAC